MEAARDGCRVHQRPNHREKTKFCGEMLPFKQPLRSGRRWRFLFKAKGVVCCRWYDSILCWSKIVFLCCSRKTNQGQNSAVKASILKSLTLCFGHSSWTWNWTPSSYQHKLGSPSFPWRRNMGICVIEETQLCVHTHLYAHACTYAALCAHTHTFSWSSWGVNFTPRLCECWPQNFATLWSEEFLKPKAVMCRFL